MTAVTVLPWDWGDPGHSAWHFSFAVSLLGCSPQTKGKAEWFYSAGSQAQFMLKFFLELRNSQGSLLQTKISHTVFIGGTD